MGAGVEVEFLRSFWNLKTVVAHCAGDGFSCLLDSDRLAWGDVDGVIAEFVMQTK